MSFMLLTAFGDWIDTNLAVVVVLIGQVIGLVTAIAVLRFQVNNNKSRIDEHDDELDKIVERQDKHREDYKAHLADTNMHVNHMHMRSIEHRMDKMENTLGQMQTTMSGGFSTILHEIRKNGK